jgi:hypothetical protein
MTDLHALLDLPETVAKSAFVVQLAAGVQNPGTVLDNYAITPDLIDAFDKALQLVRSSVDSKRSSASYIHGSFGSGKSHYLSVLSLMLSPDPAHQTHVWRDAELAPLRAKHRWLEGKKLLRLHFNMVNAESLEARVFPEYVRQVREKHPEASLPSLFHDAALFENARQLRARLGDDAFFAPLNEGKSARAGWGARSTAATWTAERFDRAVESDSLDERAALFTVLVKSHFTAWQSNNNAFVSFDKGLGELARHAKNLGYDAVVFFFDELVLWLAGGAADRKWLNSEIQKLAKVVDSDDADRPLALVSFVARQRDIAELVGDQWAGGDAQALRDSLKWWEGRFNTITLPDRNLPAIVRKRVVRPKSAEAAKALEQAFSDLRRKLGPAAWHTLLGEIGDGEEAFAKVYPFSPALVEVLVAMSATLQRERTALRLLMEVLVRHLDDFELGKVVPVGDLFDPLAGGEDPMDGVMRERFQSARRLYQQELLPVIQQENRTGTAAQCQRLRDTHSPELGCSNCRETRCRTDNRLVKTLLLAALIPNSPVLKNLTITRLVALNHGTLRAPIPNTEGPVAADRLRKYAGQVGKLRVGDGKDPSVHVVLEGVDLKPILDNARQYDIPGARKSKLRELLYTAFGFDRSDITELSFSVDWHGTSRDGSVYFGNVREMDESRFRVRPNEDFRIVIDYPFDDAGHTPQEDEARLQELKERLEERTVVWLPDFFSESLQGELGQLVVLGEILKGEAWRDHLKHLRLDDQSRTKTELESLAHQKKQRVVAAIRSAYNISAEAPDQLDPARKVQEHFHVLMPERKVSNLSVTELEGSQVALGKALLAECYPRHPEFRLKITAPLLASSLKRFAALCEREGRRDVVDKSDKRELEVSQTLGLVQLSESNVAVRDDSFAEIDRALRADHVAMDGREVSVGAVRRVLDPHRLRGLTPEVEDYLVLAYAAFTGREARLGTRALDEPRFGALSDDATLVTAVLPTADAWERALVRAGALFGVAVGSRALRSRHVHKLSADLLAAVKRSREQLKDVPSLLAARKALGAGEGDRLATLEESARLLDELARAEREGPVAVVNVLARFESPRPDAVLARAIESAGAVRSVLANTLLWRSIESMIDRDEGAHRELVELARKLLSADEHVLSLAQHERALNQRVESLMSSERAEPRPPVAKESPAVDSLALALGQPQVARPNAATTARAASAKPTANAVASGEARGGSLRAELAQILAAIERVESEEPGVELVLRWTVERT